MLPVRRFQDSACLTGRTQFEELVDQFIPSGRNWRGWVKVAFQQPLVPVLPVARELITKTKWIASKKDTGHSDRPGRPHTPRMLKPASRLSNERPGTGPRKSRELPQVLTDEPAFLTSEPEAVREATVGPKREGVRKRAISLFKRNKTHSARNSKESVDKESVGKGSVDSSDTTPTASVRSARLFLT